MNGRLSPAIALLPLLLSLISACGQQEAVRPSSDSQAIDAAYQYLVSLQPQRGLSAPREQLAPLESRRDELGQTHVRFQQVFKGIPVYGAQLIVHLDTNLSGRTVTGELVDVPFNTATEPAIDAESARETAMKETCAGETQPGELVIYSAQGKPQLAYRIPARRGLKACDVFVSATTPKVLGSVNRSPSSAGN